MRGQGVCFQSVPEAATSPHTCASDSPLQRRKGTCWACEDLRLREVQAAATPPALSLLPTFRHTNRTPGEGADSSPGGCVFTEGCFESIHYCLAHTRSQRAWRLLRGACLGSWPEPWTILPGRPPAAAAGTETDQGMKHPCPSPAVCSPL